MSEMVTETVKKTVQIVTATKKKRANIQRGKITTSGI